jgi:NTE family protein
MQYLKHIFNYILVILFLSQCAINKKRPILPEPQNISKIENPRVALVLGGGGSKGFAHLGVIDILEKNNIPIDLIVGTSAGSAVGALYADSKDISKTKSILYKAKNKELLDFSLLETLSMFGGLSSPVVGQAYEDFIHSNLTNKEFHKLKIPLVVVTVDAITGRKYIIKDGPIAPAVRASSAIPPVIAPVKLYGRTLIDGGVLEPVPVATAKKFKPQIIIAVDINNLPPEEMPSNSIELTYRALWFSYYQLSRMQSAEADIDIHPNLNGHGTFEDHRKDELFELGKKAALQALPQIKYKLKKLKISNNAYKGEDR